MTKAPLLNGDGAFVVLKNLLEAGLANYDELLPWIRAAVVVP